jgi:hypothetical protein
MKLRTLTENTTYTIEGIRHRFTVAISGTFGGGNVAVKYATDAAATTFATYASGETGTFTAAGEREFAICGAASTVQIVLAGATTPNLIVAVREIDR